MKVSVENFFGVKIIEENDYSGRTVRIKIGSFWIILFSIIIYELIR